MTKTSHNITAQTDFFSSPSHSRDANSVFAELCNALYERELGLLAHKGPTQIELLQRKLGGLSYHVKRAASYLADNNTPIDVDAHNASWQAKQANKSPARIQHKEKNVLWFSQNAAPGLVVCIRVQDFDNEHLELDSVDRIDPEGHCLHTNKFGWFDFSGESKKVDNSPNRTITLIKPAKMPMIAACCGHSWNHKGKILPRSLTLRELLLSTQIDWKHFHLPKTIG
jgi:hypothetical protein